MSYQQLPGLGAGSRIGQSVQYAVQDLARQRSRNGRAQHVGSRKYSHICATSSFGQGQHQVMPVDCQQQPAAAMPSFCTMLASAAATAALLVLPPSPALAAQLPPVQAQPTASVVLAPRPPFSHGSPSIAAPPAFDDSSLTLSAQKQLNMQPRVQEMVPGGIASEVEDQLLEVVRQFEARMDSAVGAVLSNGPRIPLLHETPIISPEEVERVTATAKTLVNEVWEVVDQNYLDARSTGWDRSHWAELRDKALKRQYKDTASVYRTIREMMALGVSDPYCRFITPAELASMKKYDVTGVGLNLGTAGEYASKTGRPLPPDQPADDTGVFVVGLSKGSPADLVGMRQGDQVLEVDGSHVKDMTPFQAASLIAGQTPLESSGSTDTIPKDYVELKLRTVEGRTTKVRIDRPVRQLTSPVTATLIKNPTGSLTGELRLTSFNARAQHDLAEAIRQMEAEGVKSLVLDLRDNRGGLVSEGLEVARLFLEGDSPIVYTASRAPTGDTPLAEGPALTRLPLMVLVNEHTASASEIVAGALHDNCRAVLVGSRTYGKGLIQSVYELSDGSGMVLTVGKYLTPNHTDIDRSGILPDFSSRPTARLAAEKLDACRIMHGQKVAPPPQM